MPKGSEKLTKARREEIISACEKLYETMNFKDITIKEIGSITSFTRTSIYNYFSTKEEIFLALLQREYELWIEQLQRLRRDRKTMEPLEFAEALAHSLESRKTLLKLMSMNHYDMEENS
ncbi:MAG: TetR/AcrR family transcriptional regulator, partial [Anaerovoracaceae bacterium]